jgi:hypothetical protein
MTDEICDWGKDPKKLKKLMKNCAHKNPAKRNKSIFKMHEDLGCRDYAQQKRNECFALKPTDDTDSESDEVVSPVRIKSKKSSKDADTESEPDEVVSPLRKKSKKSSKHCPKPYQYKNDKGRCVNKPCDEGEVRDKTTKECREKKSSSPKRRRSSTKTSKVSRKRRSSTKRSKVSRRRVSTKCPKSYQHKNDKGRCVNKPCNEGKVRDKITKKCRRVSAKTSKASRRRKPSKRVSKTSKVSRKRRSSSKCPKSYQYKNDKGRCVNKPCAEGEVRDKTTKECREKKSSSPKRRRSSAKKSKVSRRRRNSVKNFGKDMSKSDYINEIVKITGSKRFVYSNWSKKQLKQRLEALQEEYVDPDPTGCPKSYQYKNDKGRCVNRPCPFGYIRDKTTKKCKEKTRGLTQFERFYKVHIKQVRKLYPGLSSKQKMQEVVDEWYSMTPEEKDEY